MDSSPSSPSRRSSELTPVHVNNDVLQRLVCTSSAKYSRNPNLVPFHIPHKKLLEKIEFKKELPDPLTGFKGAQNKLIRSGQLKQIDKDVLSRISVVTSEGTLHSTKLARASKDETFFESTKQKKVLKITSSTTIQSVKKTAALVIPDQMEIINRVSENPNAGFLYMKYAVEPSSEVYTPYCLIVIPYSQIDKKNFLTISAQGVTQYCGDDMIFTSLDLWKHEYQMYCKLMKIRTYMQFRIWKTFFLWKKTVSLKKFKKTSKSLCKNLFILNPILRSTLLNVRAMCFKMYELNFMDCSVTENIPLFYFIEAQMGRLEQVRDRLTEFRSVSMELISNACTGALLAAGYTTDDRNLRISQMTFGPTERKPKGEMIKMSFTEQANKRRNCGRLCCFAQLLDFIVFNMLHTLITNSLTELLKVFDAHTNMLLSDEQLRSTETDEEIVVPKVPNMPQLPLFVMDLTVEPKTLLLDPAENVTIDIFTQLLDLWISTVMALRPMIADPSMIPFAHPMINNKVEERICGYGPSLKNLMFDDPFLRQQQIDVFEYIRKNYSAVYIYIQRFEPIREFYDDDNSTDPDIIRNETVLNVFRQLCTRYHDEQEIIEHVIAEQQLGMFYIHFDRFKETLIPEPTFLLEVVEETVPRIGKECVEKLILEAEEIETYLESTPLLTIEFVKYLDYLEVVSGQVDVMENKLEYVKELYDLTEENRIPVPPDEMAEYQGISITLGTLRSVADRKIEEKAKTVTLLNKQVGNDISSLISEVGVIKDELMQSWLIDLHSNPEEVMTTLNGFYQNLIQCQLKAKEYNNYQKKFRLEVTRFDMLEEVVNDVKLRLLLWESSEHWKQSVEEWYNNDFNTLDPEEMGLTIAKYVKNISQLEKGLPHNEIVPALKEKVEMMKDKMPVIITLRNVALRQRHWMKIETILSHKFRPEETLTLKILESKNVFSFPNELAEVSGQASSEASLENMLKKVEDAWKTVEFPIVPYKETKDVFILGTIEEVQTVLDDSFVTINTINSSRHVGPLKPRVDEWMKQLDLFSRTMDEWMTCQKGWMYLEVIFSAPDIQRQLPNEAKLFLMVDKTWKDTMRRTAKVPLAMQACLFPNTLQMFQKNNQILDQIMKCLEAYLETKRMAFPRFYFLSNDELLDILAQTRNPHAVQPHLRKCFDAVEKLEFGKKLMDEDEEHEEGQPQVEVLTTDIEAMISPEGERIPLVKGLKARGNVEDWLGKVEEAMFVSLRRLMKAAITDYLSREREAWVLLHANQIILTVSQIMWAKAVHLIFEQHGDISEKLDRFEERCLQDLQNLAGVIRGDMSSVSRSILKALVTVDVHAKDTITNMRQNKVHKSTDFEWLKMLRYYWDAEIDNCIARMSSAFYIYGYEYLGANGVLVITPLTDRCYLCLMGALQLDLGGAPAGPAGTGKTETTKDLSKALAIQCIVFNCSEGLDYKMMGRFFSGLAQSGAWCCFDEFNRIDIEVLSVIAQQLITIRNAKVANLNRFMFEGREIKLIRQCSAFITMNPGYAGRTELPDNLKALFRPISMMVPDYRLIAEVRLYSEGFVQSKMLSKKMTALYQLCNEQLSQQDHYDFGMRAVNSVLVMAGALKRASPDQNENITLIKALRDSNIPKFLAPDAFLFQGILGDLFPGIVLPEVDYGQLLTTIETIMEQMNIQQEACQIRKVIQLYETMIVRWGVMLVGPTGGGKTTVLNILCKSLTMLHANEVPGQYYQPVHMYTLNPKSISMGELYGEVNAFTMEWRDGLLAVSVRNACNAGNTHHQWVICDGPVDAVWIENMNTVLDDNKMLCLANSERIKLTPYIHMVFEVQDLAQASPATVSRCGMVYIDSEEIKWMPFVRTWITKFDENQITHDMKLFILELFETYVEDGFVFIKKHCAHAINQVDISKISMMCSLMESIILNPDSVEKSGDKGKIKTFLCQIFIFCYLWSLGGNLVDSSRSPFEAFVTGQFEPYEDARLPAATDLWSLYINMTKKTFQSWSKLLPQFDFDPETPFFEMLVPTIDTVRFGFVMENLLSVGKPVMFTGETGVGKSVIAKYILNKLFASGEWQPITFGFSAQTSSARTQEILELKLEKKKKTLLGGPPGKRVIVFVDDVNMPKLDTYGSQPPIELLRQYLDFGGLYDRAKLFWKRIVDVVLTCACAPPGGGRNPLTPRFVRHFAMLSIPSPDEHTLKTIFRAIIRGFLDEFADPVRELGDPMVNAAVELYQRIAVDLLPTPSKSHYVFNLRDLSKCVQGILQADGGTLREGAQMHRLFYHECLRVFHDRLICVEDKSYFYQLMKEVCSRTFGTPILTLPDDKIIANPPILLFGDFMRFGADKEDRIYEEIHDIDKLKAMLQEYLDDYNLMTNKDMRLIFFMDAIEHSTRLARILRAERGNGLLVGVGGMGKQSLTRLASHLNGYRCSQIELTRNYDHTSFFEDLRKMYFNAGCKNEDTVFLFTDTQIVQEEFLEDINNILNTGDVPNLFESDEYEKVITGSRDGAKQAGVAGSRDAIYDFFISRVRSNLHTVICMSPVGDAFRRRCRMFPSLVNCCTIDWFVKWPQEALLSVASRSLAPIGGENLTKPLADMCYLIHASVEETTERFYAEMRRYYYTTPSSYLELLKLFAAMLEKKKEKTILMRDRIANGLSKLYETNTIVAEMKKELVKMEPELAEKSESVEKLMAFLTKEQAQADQVRTVVKEDEAVALEKAAETQALADDAQRDLDTALPAMEAATKALEALNKNDINELKVFQKPPKLVTFVMESVCLLMGTKGDWASAKTLLSDVNFLKRLQEYDKDHIPDSTLRKLAAFITHKDFVPEVIAGVSKVCKSICMWVRAIDTYAKVYKVVEPKRKKQEQAERELNETMNVLHQKQKQLADVEAQLAGLQESFMESMAEKQVLEDAMELLNARMIRAGRLTMALGDEQVRWEQSVEMFQNELNNVMGDVLVAAACVAYLGAFTSSYREELTVMWVAKCRALKIPSSQSFSLITVLADPYEIRTWNTCGLPRDNVSTENGIMVTQAGRWPLMIDPQEQANRWIRQMESSNKLKIVKLTDSNFMRILESAIRIGIPVLLEEIGEKLDPTLGPVLTKQTFIQGGRKLIRLGDTDVDYDDNFRFYITTKLSNPHYLPEICIQVTIVNFTVTPSGLEDQLLADVTRLERPDLETLRTDLIVRINNDKMQLKAIEDKILKLLFASEGNILDDEELIDTLNESKETSEIIAARLIEAEATEEKISIAREGYRTVATRGSVLYFVVSQLADIDPMYQYSLKYFNQVFNTVIDTSQKNPDLQTRLEILYYEITLAVYTNISRGLFERHKLVFSFLLCIDILRQAQIIKDVEWNFLLRGAVGTKTAKKPANPFLTDAMWQNVSYLEQTFPQFKGLCKDSPKIIRLKIGNFEQKINVDNDNEVESEKNWNESLNEFEKMMILKSLQEEKLVFAITEFVKIKLGQPFIESPEVSLHLLYQGTSKVIPLVFVLSAGSDPFAAFQRFAADMGKMEKIRSISLGQGQGPIAEKMLESGTQNGEWVFLQNCHLATSWMLAMERTIHHIADEPGDVNDEFRLYLSSMPSKTFPVSVLQNSVKVTNEPPKGLKANIKRAFIEMSEEFFEKHQLGVRWRKMIFGICFFHAIIQERKKFGPLGWNIIYEFNNSDRECALLNMNMFCTSDKIPWDALEYITGEITYGGRVTDSWDLRCLKTILKGYYSPGILKKGYIYSRSGVYYCPEYKLTEEYREFIETLPIIEEPEIFGMHENANIAFQIKETQAVLVTIMEGQPRVESGGGGKSSDEIVFELSQAIVQRIMKFINPDEINPDLMQIDDKGMLPSLTTVLIQEVERYNKILKLIHSSIANLQKAIKGLVVMSDQLEEVFTAFMNNQVPKLWSAKAYPSLKSLGSWIYDLDMRLNFTTNWLHFGPPNSFWLSGFFFTTGFLSGTKQTYARKYNVPIDTLSFDFVIHNKIITQEEIRATYTGGKPPEINLCSDLPEPEDGFYIHGLFFDAARWDFQNSMLTDPKPGEINPTVPVMLLEPTVTMPDDDPRYQSPLYKTSIRAGVLNTTGHSTNFVMVVLLPSLEPQSYWILKGTAMLTQITD